MTKVSPCVFFKMGTCGKGDDCAFSHADPSQKSSKPQATPQPRATNSTRSKATCRYWSTRTCKKGDSCQLLHETAGNVDGENGQGVWSETLPDGGSIQRDQLQTSPLSPSIPRSLSPDRQDDNRSKEQVTLEAHEEDPGLLSPGSPGPQIESGTDVFVPTPPLTSASNEEEERFGDAPASSISESYAEDSDKPESLQDEGFNEPDGSSKLEDTQDASDVAAANNWDDWSPSDVQVPEEVQHEPSAEIQEEQRLATAVIPDTPMALHWTNFADPTADLNVPFCRFFAQGRCSQNDHCRFRHALSIAEHSLLFRDTSPCLLNAGAPISQTNVVSSGLGVCKFYPLGTCRNGDACPFTHSDFPPPIPPQSQGSFCLEDSIHEVQPEAGSSLPPCKFMMERGYCRNGDYCAYSHTVSDTRSSGSYENANYLGEQRWGEERRNLGSFDSRNLQPKVCRWFQEGNCFRANCTFLHQQPSDGGASDDNGRNQNWVASTPEAQTFATDCQDSRAWDGDRSNQTSFPQRKCQWYAQGRCRRGDDCRFFHERIDQSSSEGNGLDQAAEQWNRGMQQQPDTWGTEAQTWSNGPEDNGWGAQGAGSWDSWNEPKVEQPNSHDAGAHRWSDEQDGVVTEPADEERLGFNDHLSTDSQNLDDPTARTDWNEDNSPVIQGDPWSAANEDGDERWHANIDSEQDVSDEPRAVEGFSGSSDSTYVDEQPDNTPLDAAAETWNEEWPGLQLPPEPENQDSYTLCPAQCVHGDSCVHRHVPEEVQQTPLSWEAPLDTIDEPPPRCTDELPVEFQNSIIERPMFGCSVNFQAIDGYSPVKVLTASEAQRVVLFNLPPDVTYEELRELGETIAPVEYLDIEYMENLARAAVDFEHPTQAVKVATQLDGQMFGGRSLIARLLSAASESILKPLGYRTVKVSWPLATRFAWAYYKTITIAKAEATRLNGLVFLGKQIEAVFTRPRARQTESFAIKITGLPKETSFEALQRFCIGSSLVSLAEPTYTKDPMESLHYVLANAGSLETLFELPPSPNPTSKMQSAFARFSSDLSNVMTLHGKPQPFLGTKGSLSIEQVYHASYKLSQDRFLAIRDVLILLQEEHEDDCVFHILDADNPVVIYISSKGNNNNSFGPVNQRLQSHLHGEIFKFRGEIIWDEYFDLSSSVKAIERLNKDPSFFIKIDNRAQRLFVVGSAIGQQRASVAIMKLLNVVKELRHIIPIYDVTSLRTLLGGGFKALQDDVGANKVTLDVTVPQIIVRGDAEVLLKVQRAVSSSSPDMDLTEPVEPGALTCPLCYSKPSLPVKLPCQHVYCSTCLQYVLQASTGPCFILPRCIALTLAADDEMSMQCNGYIPSSALHELLSVDEQNSLLQSAFLAHIRSHLEEYFFCPTPNCEMVYRNGRPGALHRCPQCAVEVCTTCRREFHEGLTCA